MSTVSDVVLRARAALEGVTDAGWRMATEDGNPDSRPLMVFGPGWVVAHVAEAPDARFIAAARSLVPELADEVERLRVLIGRLESFAAQKAIAAHALGHGDVERGWLEVVVLTNEMLG